MFIGNLEFAEWIVVQDNTRFGNNTETLWTYILRGDFLNDTSTVHLLGHAILRVSQNRAKPRQTGANLARFTFSYYGFTTFHER